MKVNGSMYVYIKNYLELHVCKKLCFLDESGGGCAAEGQSLKKRF